MRERAESIQGIFELITAPGQDTVINVVLP